MSEENNEEKIIDTEELKKEASNVVNEVRETFKDVDMKEEGKAAKGFLKELIKNPVEKMKEMVEENSGKCFKYAVIILAIWTIVELILEIHSQRRTFFNIFSGFSNLAGFSTSIGSTILSIVLAIITPIVAILVMTLIIFLMNKGNKKSFLTVLTGVTIAKLPFVIARIVSLLTMIGSSVSVIVTPFAIFCTAISTVLLYTTAKSIFGAKKDSEFFYKFLIVEGIYYIAYIILSLIKIYI